ncbi:unnamed protein product, partial [Rotaria magnacalcarata]
NTTNETTTAAASNIGTQQTLSTDPNQFAKLDVSKTIHLHY